MASYHAHKTVFSTIELGLETVVKSPKMVGYRSIYRSGSWRSRLRFVMPTWVFHSNRDLRQYDGYVHTHHHKKMGLNLAEITLLHASHVSSWHELSVGGSWSSRCVDGIHLDCRLVPGITIETTGWAIIRGTLTLSTLPLSPKLLALLGLFASHTIPWLWLTVGLSFCPNQQGWRMPGVIKWLLVIEGCKKVPVAYWTENGERRIGSYRIVIDVDLLVGAVVINWTTGLQVESLVIEMNSWQSCPIAGDRVQSMDISVVLVALVFLA